MSITGVEIEAPAPKLTPTQRLHEVTLAALTRTTVMHRESITTSRNAKGDMQHEVVTYREDDEDGDTFEARHFARVERTNEQFPLSRKQNYDRDFLPNETGKS